MLKNGTNTIAAAALLAASVAQAATDHQHTSPAMTRRPPGKRVYISEVGVIPETGAAPCWVEIWNRMDTPVDLGKHSLETLQGRIAQFDNAVRLAPDKRCLVLFYRGREPDKKFEARLPEDIMIMRRFNSMAFPPFFPDDRWLDPVREKMLDRNGKQRPAADCLADPAFNAIAVGYHGSTRFVNEAALKGKDGALVAYACWGDFFRPPEPASGISKNFKAAAKGNLLPNTDFRWLFETRLAADNPGTGLQLCLDGVYRWTSDTTPGREPTGIPIPPELREPQPQVPGRIELNVDWGGQNPEIEWLKGWSRPTFELTYDRDMEKPVSKTPLSRCANTGGGVTLFLEPEDFFLLMDRPLYCRISKSHPRLPDKCSDVSEIVLQPKGDINRSLDSIRREKPRRGHDAIVVDGLEAERERIAGLLDACDRLYARMKKRHVSINYTVVEHGKGVILRIIDLRNSFDDLAELDGIPVIGLNVSGTAVADLSSLADMPLRELNIKGTRVEDLTPLKLCPMLESLHVDPLSRQQKDVLRTIANLGTINGLPASKSL